MSLEAKFRALGERAALLVLEGEALRGSLAVELGQAAEALEPVEEVVRDARTVLGILGPVVSIAQFVRRRKKRAAMRAADRAARRKAALK